MAGGAVSFAAVTGVPAQRTPGHRALLVVADALLVVREELFKKLHGEIDMTNSAIVAAASTGGCDLDFEATQRVIERHGLSF